MIGIINYGCGNIKAFQNVFTRLNIPAKVVASSNEILDVSHIVLPGVGAFDFVMNSFNNSGLRDIVEKKVLLNKTPVIGICAGMQILADSSEEGNEKGLGWIKGTVKLFDTSKIPFQTKIPHMGWNQIQTSENSLFNGILTGSNFYFVHSYYFEVHDQKDAIASTEYGYKFTSGVSNANIYGVQFHPEKSHHNGIQLLKNFANL